MVDGDDTIGNDIDPALINAFVWGSLDPDSETHVRRQISNLDAQAQTQIVQEKITCQREMQSIMLWKLTPGSWCEKAKEVEIRRYILGQITLPDALELLDRLADFPTLLSEVGEIAASLGRLHVIEDIKRLVGERDD